MKATQKLIATAQAEVGYLEKATNANLDSKTANAGHANYTKYARDLDKIGTVYNGKKNGFDWCDIFVDWCFIQTFGLNTAMALLCQPEKGLGAGCTYSARYFKKKGQFHKSGPQPGDQIFFSKDGGNTCYHTGIVVKVSGGRVYTIEGNTSSAAGVVANGGCVREKSYTLTYNQIGGYGRPDYTIIEEEDDEMDYDSFYHMFQKAMADYAAQLNKQAVGSYAKESFSKAKEKGVMDGTMPKAPLTREQAAVILDRIGALDK